MKRNVKIIATGIALAGLLLTGSLRAQFVPEFEPQVVRLKDIAEIQTLQDVQLLGYGLVVGLEGAGDGRGAPFTIQSLANLMRNMGVEVDAQQIRAKNTAAVMVTARMSPFVREGSTLDITVSSVGDASSLEGGVLLMTPLQADPPNGPVVAIAQGPVSIGGFNVAGAGGGAFIRNHPVVGRVPGGAIVQRELVEPGEVTTTLSVVLRDPDYTTAARLARAIDVKFGNRMAQALDAGTVRITVPRSRRTPGGFIEFIAQLEAITVIPDSKAQVVVNERTGTIVVGDHVAISEVAISHGSLSISIGPQETLQAGVPGGPQAQLQLGGAIEVEEEKPRVLALPPASSVSDVAKALNALKVTPRDIIAIFQALKRAGALKAELVIL
jgi:flagellar P-ring protein precursor FlgI